jgi:hypothetical protein
MHYVYHPHHEAVIVSTEEYQKYLDSGWYDTPTKFPKSALKEDAPVEAVEPAPVEAVEVVAIDAPKKKGRPPKAKPEEGIASI